jgi:hypothetical protein
MKTNRTDKDLNTLNKLNELNRENSLGRRFASKCVSSCRKLLAQIQTAKQAIQREFRDAFGVPEPMLHLALNEAEALAWETEYPSLVFPALAMEKAESVARWQVRQRAIWGGGREYAFAA